MTQPVQIKSRVGKDGVLTLRVPLAPSDEGAEVVITIEPNANAPHSSFWPQGYFENTYGSTADDPLIIPEDPIPPAEGIEWLTCWTRTLAWST